MGSRGQGGVKGFLGSVSYAVIVIQPRNSHGHSIRHWGIVQRQDSGFWYQLPRFSYAVTKESPITVLIAKEGVCQ